MAEAFECPGKDWRLCYAAKNKAAMCERMQRLGLPGPWFQVLGASYFRVVGKGQTYGLSARGMAIDTALPSGEEFPRFTEFWIEKPKPGDKHLVIFALLDSPRATGAYRFTLRPGVDTVVDVKAQMFLRDKVGKLGIAPLTSMYLFGANQPSKVLNYRRELHDSSDRKSVV